MGIVLEDKNDITTWKKKMIKDLYNTNILKLSSDIPRLVNWIIQIPHLL